MIGLRLVGQVVAVAALAAAIGWVVVLRPQVLGGPAAYILVSGQSMEPTLEAGSLVVALRQDSYQVGEIVAYRIPAGEPGAGLHVIHRIVGGSAEAGFVMRGDNANGSDIWRPKPNDILGKAQLIIPGAMPALIVARSPIVAASVAAALAVYLVLGLWAPDRRRVAPEAALSASADARPVEQLSVRG